MLQSTGGTVVITSVVQALHLTGMQKGKNTQHCSEQIFLLGYSFTHSGIFLDNLRRGDDLVI